MVVFVLDGTVVMLKLVVMIMIPVVIVVVVLEVVAVVMAIGQLLAEAMDWRNYGIKTTKAHCC